MVLAAACLVVPPAATASSFSITNSLNVNVNSTDWGTLFGDPSYNSTGWATAILNDTPGDLSHEVTIFQQGFSLADLPDSWTLSLTPGVGAFDTVVSYLSEPGIGTSGNLKVYGQVWESGAPASFWTGSSYYPLAITFPYDSFAGNTITEIDITLDNFSTGTWTSPINGSSGPVFNFRETFTIKGFTGTGPDPSVPEPSSATSILAGVIGLAALPASRKYLLRFCSFKR